MRVSDLERLYDFSYWANRKLFDVIAKLPEEQFTQKVSGAYGSIRNALVHVMSAEWGWLDRCGGQQRGPRLDPDDYPTAQSVIETWKRVEGYVRSFLPTLNDEDLERKVEFSIGGGPMRLVALGDLLHHSVIHAVHHRGQVALILRELGLTPGNFDLLIYCME
ncbi:MAG TPA: DinB family protein [Gemmatimonadaceae bacterium]|jgi:uncharacterized damage-inducible protein DinB